MSFSLLTLIQSTFNQIGGEAFQRVIPLDLASTSVGLQVPTRYADASAKS